jgi:hypothetical protein
MLCFGILSTEVKNAEADKNAKILESKIRERIARANLGHVPNLLPWECTSRGGRQMVKFQVLETSDLFFTLLSSSLEMVSKSPEEKAKAERATVTGAFNVWDSEKSTGIELQLSGNEDCIVRLSLPWAESTSPEIEILSGPSGFDDRQANFIGRLIINGNTSRAAPSTQGKNRIRLHCRAALDFHPLQIPYSISSLDMGCSCRLSHSSNHLRSPAWTAAAVAEVRTLRACCGLWAALSTTRRVSPSHGHPARAQPGGKAGHA